MTEKQHQLRFNHHNSNTDLRIRKHIHKAQSDNKSRVLTPLVKLR